MSLMENVHAGHRERMVEGFLKNTDGLNDHQVLEILLFFAIPRKDTNPLAHKLIKFFGDLKGVFSASVKQLMSVDGVGKKTASFIVAIAEVFKRIEAKKEKEISFSNPQQTREYLASVFAGLLREKFIMLFLDTKFRLLAKVEFTDNQRDKVSAEIPEVVSAINIYKPTYAIMAHNHTSGSALPSNEDHFATKKMNLICELHDVNLIDHIIISFDDSFSYKGENLIDNIKRQCNLKNIFNGIKEV
ncbi:MAG: hypothetical protein E7372_01700 [Clostridiales bacterium]|nr:hypothetical protein [Clostridiales bacterium]